MGRQWHYSVSWPSVIATGMRSRANDIGVSPSSWRRPWCCCWVGTSPPLPRAALPGWRPLNWWKTALVGSRASWPILAAPATGRCQQLGPLPTDGQLQPVAPAAPAHVVEAVVDQIEAPCRWQQRAPAARRRCAPPAPPPGPDPAPARPASGGFQSGVPADIWPDRSHCRGAPHSPGPHASRAAPGPASGGSTPARSAAPTVVPAAGWKAG